MTLATREARAIALATKAIQRARLDDIDPEACVKKLIMELFINGPKMEMRSAPETVMADER